MAFSKVAVVALLAMTAMASAHGQSAASGQDARRFVGTWRLIELTREGLPDPNRGPHPTGMIFYDNTGHMAAQIMPDRVRPRYDRNRPTAEQAHGAILGYAAYFGTYVVDERARTVTHHREGNINSGELGDFVRRYEFDGADRVILRPVENQDRLVWERIK